MLCEKVIYNGVNNKHQQKAKVQMNVSWHNWYWIHVPELYIFLFLEYISAYMISDTCFFDIIYIDEGWIEEN